MTPSTGSFFDLFDVDWFGSWGLWLWSALQILGIMLFITIITVSLEHCILSKPLNACLQPLTTKQMIFLRLEHQKRNEENDQKCELEVMNYEYHRDSAKRHHDLWTPHKISKNSKNFRAVAGSGAKALNFDQVSVRLSQLRQHPKMESLNTKPHVTKPRLNT